MASNLIAIASKLIAMTSNPRAATSNLIAMASKLRAMASNLRAMASNLRAMASSLRAMASNLIAMASNLIAMASNLRAMASNLVAMASNLRAMASKLRAMASNLIAKAASGPVALERAPSRSHGLAFLLALLARSRSQIRDCYARTPHYPAFAPSVVSGLAKRRGLSFSHGKDGNGTRLELASSLYWIHERTWPTSTNGLRPQ